MIDVKTFRPEKVELLDSTLAIKYVDYIERKWLDGSKIQCLGTTSTCEEEILIAKRIKDLGDIKDDTMLEITDKQIVDTIFHEISHAICDDMCFHSESAKECFIQYLGKSIRKIVEQYGV